MTVWVLIAVFYGQNPVVIDNIKDSRSCQATGARLMQVAAARGYMVAIDCMPVARVKP